MNRHASNLELFLDLVFVFAVTQITSLVAADVSVGGVAKAALLGFLVWWQWTAFTWAGTAIDIQADGRALALVLCMVPAMLVMAIAASRAFAGQGVWFAGSYLIVQLFVLFLHGVAARSDRTQRRSWLRYAPLAAAAPSIVVLGSLGHGQTRVAGWCVGAAVMVASALFAADGVSDSVTIDPVHFGERHALFVIISLGELLVAIGATASSAPGLRTGSVLAIIATAMLACALWWSYFGFVPAAVEYALHKALPPERARLGRDVGSFFHFPLVFGIMLFAVAAKHLVRHPTGHLSGPDRLLMFAAAVSFVGGQLLIQFRVVARLAPERIVAVVAVGILAVLAGLVSATLIVALVAVVLAATSTITWRRFRSSEFAEAAPEG